MNVRLRRPRAPKLDPFDRQWREHVFEAFPGALDAYLGVLGDFRVRHVREIVFEGHSVGVLRKIFDDYDKRCELAPAPAFRVVK